jgi:hypothetical protein
MTESRQVIKPPDVLLQDLEGEAVLLNLKNGQYYGLDENSFHMYKALISSPSVEAARAVLMHEYDVAPDRLQADLDRFLEHLLENGLITFSGSGPE